jgi:hypothetical protein
MIDYVTIEKQELRNNIIQFINENLANIKSEHALVLSFNSPDICNYNIYYELNLSVLMKKIPPFYAIIESTYVFINANDGIFSTIRKDKIDRVIRNPFANQYDFFLKESDYPVIITYRGEMWKFENNVLVEKSVY